MNPDPSAPTDVGLGAHDRSVVDDLRALLSDSKAFAAAEVDFQRKRLVHAGRSAPAIIGLVALSLALLFFALMALVFGTVLSVAAALGPVVATVIVVSVLLVLAILAVVLALSRWKRLRAALVDDRPRQGTSA